MKELVWDDVLSVENEEIDNDHRILIRQGLDYCPSQRVSEAQQARIRSRHKALFERYADNPLPDWAAEFDAETLAQFFLKFVISHPAVTCAIPATSRVDHMPWIEVVAAICCSYEVSVGRDGSRPLEDQVRGQGPGAVIFRKYGNGLNPDEE